MNLSTTTAPGPLADFCHRSNECSQDGGRKEPLIICVDDDPNCVSALQRILRPFAIQFRGTYNAVQAFEFITTEKPDLILCDILMPMIQGTELIGWLRNNRMVDSIPLIVLTGHEEARECSLANGANSFLTKPIAAEELLCECKKYISMAVREKS